MILVAGGQLDPNMGALLRRILARGVAFRDLLVGPTLKPVLMLDLDGRFELDGEAIEPSACFVRHDVFLSQKTGDPSDERAALNWYYAIRGWALSRPDVRLLNRGWKGADAVKIEALVRAREAGLAVPETVVSNASEAGPAAGGIRKPVAGGALTQWLLPTDRLDYPHFLQPGLRRPELRIYRVGGNCFAFEIESPDLDYRERQDVRLASAEVPASLGTPLVTLCDRMGLDFAAADFMRGDDGEWRFLEVNSQPMFAAFDKVVSGRLSDAIIDWLLPGAGAPPS